MDTLPDMLGLGFYSVPEAARLAELTPAQVRGWLLGDPREDGSRGGRQGIGHLLPEIQGKIVFSFRELIELRVVRHFLRAGVAWKAIRRMAPQARHGLLDETGYGLRYTADGVTTFAQRLARDGDMRATELVANQEAVLAVLKKNIRSEFDLDAGEIIRAWHPRAETPLVLLDPRRSFGHPLVEPGVPTMALTDALRAEGGDVARVAALFGASNESVRQAAAFETMLAA